MTNEETGRLISPFAKQVPPELLPIIFEYFLPDLITDRNDAARAISLCCSSWRDLMRNVVPTWNIIHVYSTSGDTAIAEQHVHLVQYYLSNAERLNRPLSLKLHEHNGDTTSMEYKLVDQILLMFVAHAKRWENIDFRILAKHVEDKFKQFPTYNLSLRSAQAELSNIEDFDAVGEFWSALDCKSLRQVTTTFRKTVSEPYIVGIQSIRFQQITCLVLKGGYGLTLSPLLQLLKESCSRLEVLAIAGGFTLDASILPQNLVSLSRLHTLVIQCDRNIDTFSTFLECIVASNLRHLCIICDGAELLNNEVRLEALDDLCLRYGVKKVYLKDLFEGSRVKLNNQVEHFEFSIGEHPESSYFE